MNHSVIFRGLELNNNMRSLFCDNISKKGPVDRLARITVIINCSRVTIIKSATSRHHTIERDLPDLLL